MIELYNFRDSWMFLADEVERGEGGNQYRMKSNVESRGSFVFAISL